MPARQPTRGVQALVAVAVVACGCLSLLVLWATGRPLATPDLWFHLKAGETYLQQGLWLASGSC